MLIVDDERFNCDIIYGFMMLLAVQNRKAKTDFAYNGEQAIQQVQKAITEGEPLRYPLILMDCNMPFIDGYEATKQIRLLYREIGIERNKQPKIIAVTGHVENEYIAKAIESGMDKVFSKPLNCRDFGLLLLEMGFIDEMPQHLVD